MWETIIKGFYHVTQNASVTVEFASGFQEIYLLIFLLALVSNMSISAWLNCFVMKVNVSFESIHSVVPLNCLDFCLFQYSFAQVYGQLRSRLLVFWPILRFALLFYSM